MADIPEADWKRRFAVTLCARLVGIDVPHEMAVASAKGHADDHYPNRTDLDPEADAELFYLTLIVV